MSSEERIMTALFWRSLRNQTFGIELGYFKNLRDQDYSTAQHQGVVSITYHELEQARDVVNKSMIEAIQDGVFNGGIIPDEAFPDNMSSKKYKYKPFIITNTIE